MDTSETYIKMCEKATEIQKLAFRIGGRFEDYPNEDILIDFTGSFYFANNATLQTTKSPEWDGALIWLPRQDQLQEMVGLNQHNVDYMFPKLSGFHFRNMYEAIENKNLADDKGDKLINDNQRKMARHFRHLFTSMEQLWLAFVMSEKFGKIWNGEEWVAQK
jgi:hypothetical protein